MSDFYSELAIISDELIDEFGKDIILRQSYLAPVWVKATARTAAGVTTTWTNSRTAVVVAVDPTIMRNYPGRAVEGTYKGAFLPHLAIEAGDLRLYAVRIPLPKTGDTLFVNGIDMTVKSVLPIRPADGTLLYDIQLR